ncbi:MAG: hypothetical protein R2762_01365 [Bryobacteraceae bacterium]
MRNLSSCPVRRMASSMAVAVAILSDPTGMAAEDGLPFAIRATRSKANPIVAETMLSKEDGDSINGPTLIRVPSWVEKPLGNYYLYFAHHAGKYIRLAYADRLEGPWKIHAGGVLRIENQKRLRGHIASPEAVVDEAGKKIYLYYHGRPSGVVRVKGVNDEEAGQISSVAASDDGLRFTAVDAKVGPSYLRVFRHQGDWYAINGHGALLRSRSLGEEMEELAGVIGDDIAAAIDPVKLGEPGASDRAKSGSERYSIRHVGADIAGGYLLVYFSCVGHRPERIFVTAIAMQGDPRSWRARGTQEVLRPEEKWEGAGLPLVYSRGGRSRAWENGLRDPAIFREDGRVWMLYSSAGEHGIGLAELQYQPR